MNAPGQTIITDTNRRLLVVLSSAFVVSVLFRLQTVIEGFTRNGWNRFDSISVATFILAVIFAILLYRGSLALFFSTVSIPVFDLYLQGRFFKWWFSSSDTGGLTQTLLLQHMPVIVVSLFCLLTLIYVWASSWRFEKFLRQQSNEVSRISTADYELTPNGQKRFLKATTFDILISIILPGWGIIVGLIAFFKGEKKRASTMIDVGICIILLSIFIGGYR